MSINNRGKAKEYVLLLACTICSLVMYLLPWCFVDLTLREQISIWRFASICGNVPDYLSIRNYTTISYLFYMGAGLAVLILIFDLCNVILRITGRNIGISLNNPSVIIPVLFPIFFVVWFLENEVGQALNGMISIWPILSSVLGMAGIWLKNRLDD